MISSVLSYDKFDTLLGVARVNRVSERKTVRVTNDGQLYFYLEGAKYVLKSSDESIFYKNHNEDLDYHYDILE